MFDQPKITSCHSELPALHFSLNEPRQEIL